MSRMLASRALPSPEPPSGDHRGVGASVRMQILATEHWSLMATRGMTWTEMFSRTGTFLTILSAAVIALSLVAQAADFGTGFRVFALLVLPIVLFVGLATYVRLVEADIEDVWLVVGMNRLRHAYLDLAPDLGPYFVTSQHDDELGVLRTYIFRTDVGVSHLLRGSPVIVGIIDSVLAGIIAGVACQGRGVAGRNSVGGGAANRAHGGGPARSSGLPQARSTSTGLLSAIPRAGGAERAPA